MTTWRVLIRECMECDNSGETMADVVGFAPVEPEWLDVLFDAGYGGSEGTTFTLWTDSRVYFPVVHDGAESVASVPRNPCGETVKHVGGQ